MSRQDHPMNRPGNRAPAQETAPHGYQPLERLGPQPQAQAGCPLALGLLLTLLGAGPVALYFINPAGRGSPWVMLAVGLLFSAVGLLLLAAGIIGMRGLRVPQTKLFLEEGAILGPGVVARLRFRQAGPVTFDSLVVRLVAERVYLREAGSGSTLEDRERLREAILLEFTRRTIPAGRIDEEEIVMEIPADAPPSGPALPDGTIRWLVEVAGDAGVLRGIYHSFALHVHPSPPAR